MTLRAATVVGLAAAALFLRPVPVGADMTASVSWTGHSTVIGVGAGEKLALDLVITGSTTGSAHGTVVVISWPESLRAPLDVFERVDGAWQPIEDAGADYVVLPGGGPEPGRSQTRHLGLAAVPGPAIDPGASYRAAVEATHVTAALRAVDPAGHWYPSDAPLASDTYTLTASPLRISADWPRTVAAGRTVVLPMSYENRSDTAFGVRSTTRPEAYARFLTKGSRISVTCGWSLTRDGPWHDALFSASAGEPADPTDEAYARFATLPVPAHSTRRFFVRLTVNRAATPTLEVKDGFWDPRAGHTFGWVHSHRLDVGGVVATSRSAIPSPVRSSAPASAPAVALTPSASSTLAAHAASGEESRTSPGAAAGVVLAVALLAAGATFARRRRAFSPT